MKKIYLFLFLFLFIYPLFSTEYGAGTYSSGEFGEGQTSTSSGSSLATCYQKGGYICKENEFCPTYFLANVSDSDSCCATKCIKKEQTQETIVLDINSFDINSFPKNLLPKLLKNKTQVKNISYSKKVKIDLSKSTPNLIFTLTIKNTSKNPFFNISVIDSIPKSLAPEISKINFQKQTIILEKDPVFAWNIPKLDANSYFSFSYLIENPKNTDFLNDLNSFVASLSLPLLLQNKPEFKQIVCDDFNPCTKDFVLNNICHHQKLSNISCGENKICIDGKCQTKQIKPTSSKNTPTQKQLSFNPLFLLFLLAIAILSFYFFYLKKK